MANVVAATASINLSNGIFDRKEKKTGGIIDGVKGERHTSTIDSNEIGIEAITERTTSY